MDASKLEYFKTFLNRDEYNITQLISDLDNSENVINEISSSFVTIMFLYLGRHHVLLQNLGLKRNQTGSLLNALQCVFENPEKNILYQKLMKNKQIFMKAKKKYCIIKKKKENQS